jgi:hypothetical protein
MIDPVQLWSQYTEVPENRKDDAPFISGLFCPNPEHYNSRKPGPFQINVTQPTVHCFAHCGISGTYEHAISIAGGISEREARRVILRFSRVAVGPQSKRKSRRGGAGKIGYNSPVTGEISLDYDSYLPPIAVEYLAARGIGGEGISTFGLGWSPDERRIVIPAHDERGTLKFLIKRSIREKDWPKYLNSDDSAKTSLLFGACVLDREQVESFGLILVEGPFDVIRNHLNGWRNTAGILGSYLSTEQRRVIGRIRPPRVICMFDKNVAGIRALRHAQGLLKKYPVFVVRYPHDKSDPGELNRREAERAVERAVPYVKVAKALTRGA